MQIRISTQLYQKLIFDIEVYYDVLPATHEKLMLNHLRKSGRGVLTGHKISLKRDQTPNANGGQGTSDGGWKHPTAWNI
ncbi:unnamed protein product [Caenorhabditis brenneri]